MPVVNATADTFAQEVLQSQQPVLVDFWAPWCGPCKMIAPVLEDLASEYGDQLKVVKLDVQTHQSVAAEYGVRNIPALFVFKNGQIVDRQVGAVPRSQLEALVKPHLA